MALVAPDGHWLRVNQGAVRDSSATQPRNCCASIFRRSPILRTLWPTWPPCDRCWKARSLTSRWRSGTFISLDTRSGPCCPCPRFATSQGTFQYFISQIQDITARKEAEARLIESDFRYRATADLLPGFVFEGKVVDGIPQPTWVSAGFEQVFGCSLAEFGRLGGKTFYDDATARQTQGQRGDCGPGRHGPHGVVAAASGRHEAVAKCHCSPELDRRRARIWRGQRHYRAQAPGTCPRRGYPYTNSSAWARRSTTVWGKSSPDSPIWPAQPPRRLSAPNSPLAADLQQLAKLAAQVIETSRDIARGVSPLTESRGSLVHSLRKLPTLPHKPAGAHRCSRPLKMRR